MSSNCLCDIFCSYRVAESVEWKFRIQTIIMDLQLKTLILLPFLHLNENYLAYNPVYFATIFYLIWFGNSKDQ